jgi:hypothetical protein
LASSITLEGLVSGSDAAKAGRGPRIAKTTNQATAESRYFTMKSPKVENIDKLYCAGRAWKNNPARSLFLSTEGEEFHLGTFFLFMQDG